MYLFQAQVCDNIRLESEFNAFFSVYLEDQVVDHEEIRLFNVL